VLRVDSRGDGKTNKKELPVKYDMVALFCFVNKKSRRLAGSLMPSASIRARDQRNDLVGGKELKVRVYGGTRRDLWGLPK